MSPIATTRASPTFCCASDHPFPQILKHRGARNRKGIYFGPFASAGAVNRTLNTLAARLSAALLLGFACSRAARGRACSSRSSAAARRASGGSTVADYGALVDEAKSFLTGKSRGVQDSLRAEMHEASDALDFERAAQLARPPPRHEPHPVAPGHQPLHLRGSRCLRRPSAKAAIPASRCSSSAPGRIGATAPISRATTGAAGREVLESFLGQFYDDAPPHADPALGRHSRARAAGRGPVAARRHKVEIPRPQRGEKREIVEQRSTNAREQLARRLAENSAQARAAGRRRRSLRPGRAPRRIEVYDNSHIQGAQRGRRHHRGRAGRLREKRSTANSTSRAKI